MKNVAQDLLEYGFYFVYWYSERDKLMIHFDSGGIVEQVELVDPLRPLTPQPPSSWSSLDATNRFC